MIRRKIKGKSFLGERVHNIRLQGSVHHRAEECVTTKDSDYVDDVNICIEDEEDHKEDWGVEGSRVGNVHSHLPNAGDKVLFLTKEK